jgi:hypothetical protein
MIDPDGVEASGSLREVLVEYEPCGWDGSDVMHVLGRQRVEGPKNRAQSRVLYNLQLLD